MKLNPDCIRNILFAIEDLSVYNSCTTSTELSQTPFLIKYSEDEILYHLQQLSWDNYIVTPKTYKTMDGDFLVFDLSPKGHEFISNIRQDNNWNKVKSISKEIGTNTLTSLLKISENVIACAIKSTMGLN